MGYWPYNILFEKYKADCTIFFETGTHKGDSVQDAYDLGFKRIISIEKNKEFYNECMERFQPLDAWEQIKLFLGRTEDNIEKLIQDWVNDRTMFWLDAHSGGGGTVPLQLEVEAIMKHERNDHIILIDDWKLYEINKEKIKETLLNRNPLYKFTETRVHRHCGDQFIAYI